MNHHLILRSAIAMSTLVAVCAPEARAQGQAAPSPALATAAPPSAPEYDWAVTVGVGVQSFTGTRADDAVDIGVAYDARVAFGLQSLIGIEAAFIGSSQAINALGLDPDADLRSWGFEALARLSLDRIVAPTIGPVRTAPFLFAGAAFQRFTLADEGINTSDVANSDNTVAIPIGAGIGAIWQRVNFDARFTYRNTFDEDLFREPLGGNADASLSHWTLGIRGGVEF